MKGGFARDQKRRPGKTLLAGVTRYRRNRTVLSSAALRPSSALRCTGDY